MKITKLLPLAFVPFLLLGCTGGGKSSSPYIGDLKDKYENLQLAEKDVIQEGGGYGGTFLDVAVKRFLSTESTFLFSFTSKHSIDPSFTVKLSTDKHMTVGEINNGKFNVTTTAVAGDTIMTMYDSDGVLIYRNIIRVRPKQTKETIINAIDSAQYYKILPEVKAMGYGSWTFQSMSLEENTLTCTLAGGDEYDPDNKCRFTLSTAQCEYSEGADWYCFKALNSVSENRSTIITYICVAAAADVMYAYAGTGADEGLIAYLYHSDVEYLYK